MLMHVASVVQPGMNLTEPSFRIGRGKNCSATYNLEGWQIHSMTVVERPKGGRVEVRGTNVFFYYAGAKPGPDVFVIEFDTTQFDFDSGQPTFRSKWRVRQPLVIE
jgi:hypothetical protein